MKPVASTHRASTDDRSGGTDRVPDTRRRREVLFLAAAIARGDLPAEPVPAIDPDNPCANYEEANNAIMRQEVQRLLPPHAGFRRGMITMMRWEILAQTVDGIALLRLDEVAARTKFTVRTCRRILKWLQDNEFGFAFSCEEDRLAGSGRRAPLASREFLWLPFVAHLDSLCAMSDREYVALIRRPGSEEEDDEPRTCAAALRGETP